MKPGDSSRLYSKSKLILEDLKTKLGTTVNGISIKGQRRTFEEEYNEIKLGHFDQVFRIRWVPIVLTFSFTGKELRSNEISKFADKVEPLDMKVSTSYERGSTTHVVAKKRNTSKGLQALINGKYIVDQSYVDAMMAAGTEDEDGISPLERDFDANWPNETEHLPPQGLEQTERRSEAYAPDRDRQEIFDGYTFIFYDQAQFDNLIAPITQGKGKALLHLVDPSSTTPDEFVRYVKNVAGEKGLGVFEDGSEGKGVVVVKYQPLKGDTLPFYQDFGRRVALQLDHRLIEQSEFLDAILNNNASVLRRPLEIDPSSTAGAAPTPRDELPARQQYQDDAALSSSTAQTLPYMPPPAAKRVRTRRTVTSRFKGFDEEFANKKEEEEPESMQGIVQQPESQLFVSNSQPADAPSQYESLTERRRKRQREEEQQQQENKNILDELAPAATRLKRLRLKNEDKARAEGREPEPQSLPEPTPESAAPAAKKKPAKKDINILEVTKKQREEQDRRAKEERQALEEAPEGIDSAAVRRLIPTAPMTVRSITENEQRWNQDQNSRWSEAWNGRPNFKKFKRKGDRPRLMQKVIVPLQVAGKREMGGDMYWLAGESESQARDKEREAGERMDSFISDPQTQTATQRNEEEIEKESETQHRERVQITLDDSDDEDTPPVILNARRKVTRASPAPRRPESVMRDPSLGMASQPGRKRQASEVRDGPAKRAKSNMGPVGEAEEESDDGGLGFKFRKKR